MINNINQFYDIKNKMDYLDPATVFTIHRNNYLHHSQHNLTERFLSKHSICSKVGVNKTVTQGKRPIIITLPILCQIT